MNKPKWGRKFEDDDCPKGGDTTSDCAGCVYSGEYHYDNNDCVKRKAYHQGYLDALDHVAKQFSAIFDLPTKPTT